MTDMRDPRTLHPKIDPPKQTQPHPGLDAELEPKGDLGLDTYQGNGRLKGRKALITGGDSGIGAAVAIAYAREGADVAIAYLPEEEPDAEKIIQAIEDAGQKALALPGDLQELAQCEAIVEKTVEAFGGLDILVNNASRQIWHDGIGNIPDDDFDATMKSNIYSSYRVTKAALPHLKPGSSIIFTSSIQAYEPSPHLLDYAMTKAAMNNLSKGLAQQLAPEGIRVNAVAPGPVWTPLQPSHGQPQDKIEGFGQHAPLGRAGQPAELAGAYVFLASDEASYVMGETLGVTGGSPTP
ncbi:SDR family oxidoreductase [Corynebacterium marinum]|uniref:Putative oxidoreductase YghA n=1 Tax=Corynebacterium marinum DSM 44953 TaxID=1224162 RepID=A0A0B6TVG4_9CORY|nr:SDR family oxidoreductase [Corynebacterium marinum]AJK69600.1 putative oxidoreductase YghA [Corynebacterium marinum DSM 44953]GGO22622.1 dehydrogenase [Corynebacterium marinum]